MRTETIKVYKFKELSEQAQEKALEKLYDLNVDHSWWDFTYDDAAQIGLKITAFDLDRGSFVKGEFTEDATKVADLIMANHGEGCETYKDAKQFWIDWGNLVYKHSDGKNTEVVTEDNEYEFDQEADEPEQEFLKTLCEDYRIILQKEYEYLTSEEAVIETIEANDYEFTADGEMY